MQARAILEIRPSHDAGASRGGELMCIEPDRCMDFTVYASVPTHLRVQRLPLTKSPTDAHNRNAAAAQVSGRLARSRAGA